MNNNLKGMLNMLISQDFDDTQMFSGIDLRDLHTLQMDKCSNMFSEFILYTMDRLEAYKVFRENGKVIKIIEIQRCAIHTYVYGLQTITETIVYDNFDGIETNIIDSTTDIFAPVIYSKFESKGKMINEFIYEYIFGNRVLINKIEYINGIVYKDIHYIKDPKDPNHIDYIVYHKNGEKDFIVNYINNLTPTKYTIEEWKKYQKLMEQQIENFKINKFKNNIE